MSRTSATMCKRGAPHQVRAPMLDLIPIGLSTMREFRMGLVCEVCGRNFATSRFLHDEDVADANGKPDAEKVKGYVREMMEALIERHGFVKYEEPVGNGDGVRQ